ncbi:MAG: hypothetical protein JSR89_01465 [Proteobacteria bacterium]|nr:hypothetical protein [Pseudomonadota bacterium]
MNFYYAIYAVTETTNYGTQSLGKFNCTIKAETAEEAKTLVMEHVRKKMGKPGGPNNLTIEVEIMETVGY